MYKVEITGVDTSKLETISNDEMIKLLKEIREGNQKSREIMINGNLKLILSVLKKFNNKKETMDDLFQVGCIGLIKAIDNFDPSFNVKFSTYAVPMIIGEIKRHLRDNSILRVSRSLKDIAYKSMVIKENFIKYIEREPSIDELALIIGCEEIDILMSMEAIQDPISIFSPIYDNGSDVIELQDQLSSSDNVYNNYEKDNMLRKALSTLEGRERDIIKDRYFLNKTQSEIADELGISQAQVSRIEKNALKSMLEKIKK